MCLTFTWNKILTYIHLKIIYVEHIDEDLFNCCCWYSLNSPFELNVNHRHRDHNSYETRDQDWNISAHDTLKYPKDLCATPIIQIVIIKQLTQFVRHFLHTHILRNIAVFWATFHHLNAEVAIMLSQHVCIANLARITMYQVCLFN